MQKVTQLHHDAMEFADAADAAQRQGHSERAADLNRQAFEKEREAANIIADRDDLEPTRSILHRSAASLALVCNEIREAERLITYALSACPPVEIADELRDLLENVDLKQIQLVGFTAPHADKERIVAFTTPRSRISSITRKEPKTLTEQRVEVRGTLLEADATSRESGHIEIVEPSRKKHRVRVPRGMMSDIVKPMFEEEVIVTGVQEEKDIVLDTIDLAEPEDTD